MKKIKFPKIDEDNDLRKTLTVRKIIQKMHSIGFSQRFLGRFFSVNKSTIGAYLKPAKILRDKRYLFKRDIRESSSIRQDRRKAVIEKMLVWEREQCKNRRKDRKRPYRPILTIRKYHI